MGIELYNQYFSEKDFNEGLIDFLFDVKKFRISKKEAYQLIEELYNQGAIVLSTQFEKKKLLNFNSKYIEYLLCGISVGKTSKKYLIHFVNVCHFVRIKKIIIGLFLIIITMMLYRMFSKSLMAISSIIRFLWFAVPMALFCLISI